MESEEASSLPGESLRVKIFSSSLLFGRLKENLTGSILSAVAGVPNLIGSRSDMVSALILSITFLVVNILLFASTFYQILILSDLEADYINMYEAASLINRWIMPDFVLQGVLSLILLVTGHWFMFLVSVPITCYHVMLYMKKRHLIDVTEIFRVISAEKKYRLVKLGLLSILFLFVVFRLVFSVFEAFVDEDDAF